MEFFDSHAHYNDEKYDEDREEIIKKIFEEGITRLVCVRIQHGEKRVCYPNFKAK